MLQPTYTGKVITLDADNSGAFVQLAPATDAKDNWLQLPLAHPNYSTIYALLMASASNKLPIRVTIDATSQATYPPITGTLFSFPT